MNSARKKLLLKRFTFFTITLLLVVFVGCSSDHLTAGDLPGPPGDPGAPGIVDTSEPPDCGEKELKYDKETKTYSCVDRESVGFDIECPDDQIALYDTDKKEPVCTAKTAKELFEDCADENYENGVCTGYCEYVFPITGSGIPPAGQANECTAWAECRRNTTVGSDFNGDCRDDIAIASPTSMKNNNAQELFNSLGAIFGVGDEIPATGLDVVGGRLNLMLMKNPTQFSGAQDEYETDEMVQIKIQSDLVPGTKKPLHILGMSSVLQDINGDLLADLIYTGNNLSGDINDAVFILFGMKTPLGDWGLDFSPVADLNNDFNGDGKADSAAILLPENAIVQNIALFDFNGDGAKDLAIGVYEPPLNNGRIYIFENESLRTKLDASNDKLLMLAEAFDYRLNLTAPMESYDALGSKIVGVDIDNDGNDELASEMVLEDGVQTKNVIMIVDWMGEKIGDSNLITSFKPNGEADNSFVVSTGVVVETSKSSDLLSMTAANLDEPSGQKDDLVIAYKWPDNNNEAEFGRTHLVAVLLGDDSKYSGQWLGNPGVMDNNYFPDSIADIVIWGNEDDEIGFDSRCPLHDGEKQKDRSAVGVDISVMPGIEGPDFLIISDPRYDLDGFCPLDYRGPRLYKFIGNTNPINIKGKWHVGLTGISKSGLLGLFGAQPYLNIPSDDLIGRFKWWGWQMGVVGNIQDKGDPLNLPELLVGVPGDVAFGANIPLFNLIADGLNQPEPDFLISGDLDFDFSGSVEMWSNALDGEYDQNNNYTIRPSINDYVDLFDFLMISGGFDIWEIISQLLGGLTVTADMCDGTYTCDDITDGDVCANKVALNPDGDAPVSLCVWTGGVGPCAEKVAPTFDCALIEDQDECNSMLYCSFYDADADGTLECNVNPGNLFPGCLAIGDKNICSHFEGCEFNDETNKCLGTLGTNGADTDWPCSHVSIAGQATCENLGICEWDAFNTKCKLDPGQGLSPTAYIPADKIVEIEDDLCTDKLRNTMLQAGTCTFTPPPAFDCMDVLTDSLCGQNDSKTIGICNYYEATSECIGIEYGGNHECLETLSMADKLNQDICHPTDPAKNMFGQKCKPSNQSVPLDLGNIFQGLGIQLNTNLKIGHFGWQMSN